MLSIRITNELLAKRAAEESVILKAVGASYRGDDSLRDMIATVDKQKFEQCKDDPNQFNAPYAYAKTRYMLNRHDFLLGLLESSEQDFKRELQRVATLTEVDVLTLWSRYFAISDATERFDWVGSLAAVETRLMYDLMQMILLHPGATIGEYEAHMADATTLQMISALQDKYDEWGAEGASVPTADRQALAREEPQAVSAGKGGCLLIVVGAVVLMSIVAFSLLP